MPYHARDNDNLMLSFCTQNTTIKISIVPCLVNANFSLVFKKLRRSTLRPWVPCHESGYNYSPYLLADSAPLC